MSVPPTYLKRRKLGWYVQLPVPQMHQEAMGTKVLTRSLRTRDEGEAHKLRHRVIAELQQLINQATPAAPEALTAEGILEAARAHGQGWMRARYRQQMPCLRWMLRWATS